MKERFINSMKKLGTSKEISKAIYEISQEQNVDPFGIWLNKDKDDVFQVFMMITKAGKIPCQNFRWGKLADTIEHTFGKMVVETIKR